MTTNDSRLQKNIYREIITVRKSTGGEYCQIQFPSKPDLVQTRETNYLCLMINGHDLKRRIIEENLSVVMIFLYTLFLDTGRPLTWNRLLGTRVQFLLRLQSLREGSKLE